MASPLKSCLSRLFKTLYPYKEVTIPLCNDNIVYRLCCLLHSLCQDLQFTSLVTLQGHKETFVLPLLNTYITLQLPSGLLYVKPVSIDGYNLSAFTLSCHIKDNTIQDFLTEDIFQCVKNLLKDISPCHGYDHALAVYNHTVKATDKNIVRLAALLHDVDDPKFFKTSNYSNARSILKKCTNLGEEDVEQVVRMISLVSSSANGDSIPYDVKDNTWMLIPRWCDRLEAIGPIGIERCATFRRNVTKAPYFVSSTPRPKDEKEVWEAATKERYSSYKDKSESMIDHYFDKLLRLGSFWTDNSYIKEEANKRTSAMCDFVLWAVKNEKELNDDMIQKYLQDK